MLGLPGDLIVLWHEVGIYAAMTFASSRRNILEDILKPV